MASSGGGRASEPPHRCFVAVELPFCLAPSGPAEVQRRAVEAILPPSFLAPCVDGAAPLTARPSAAEKPGGVAQSPALGPAAAAAAADECIEESDEADEAWPVEASGTQGPSQLQVTNPDAYRTEPVFSGWRSTKWGGEAEALASAPPALQVGAEPSLDGMANPHESAGGRLDVFPSLEPQLLLHGYYRNDLLVRVRRRRRVRRYRDARSGAVVREEELSSSSLEEEEEGGAGVAVVGVVSREVELARPADFTFSLFTPEQRKQAPELCSADLFPPARYLSEKAPMEVRYLMGKRLNRSVGQLLPPHDADALGGGGVLENDAARGVATVPNVLVHPDDAHFPPPQAAGQVRYLASIGCSPTGTAAEDPAEVQVIAGLLQHRPAWMIRDLMATILETGRCPRMHFNKQVILALTYNITTGPFHRLRVRLGYDPYATARSVVYQRFSVRFLRRSELGTHLRDLSRSPFIAQVIKQLLERHRSRIHAYKAREAAPPVQSTLVEQLCRIVVGGTLWTSFQLIDTMDDPVMSEIARHCVGNESMPRKQRPHRNGWLSETAFLHVTSNFAEKLGAFIAEEVIPQLRILSGGRVQLPQDEEEGEADNGPAKSNDSNEEESKSSLSASSSRSPSKSSRSSGADSSLSGGGDGFGDGGN